ncbi:MAG: stage 0 sporulation protein [Clostridia bacterium]|nr:stage 0 sporulation protein [Clostridia bacterium]
MQKVIGAKFNDGGKIYYFNPNNLTINAGDRIVVETSAGMQIATCVFIDKEVEGEFEIKDVLRIATEKDENKKVQLDAKIPSVIKQIKEKVKAQKLDMKISDCFYTLDGGKLVVEFTAEDRVDFRELLKDLASTFKVRIELKQLGQRDEVKNKGGLGPCGEICCCKRYLNDFSHVSVKMAKTQGISLSPTKINGLCGRLMCCLAYENSNYEEVLKKMPKMNSEVTSPKGKGVCVYRDALRELVSVKFTGNDGNITVEEFKLEDIKF